MRIVALISRILLGIIFTVFGLNGFLHFLPMVLPPGPAGTFFTVTSTTHYMVVVFAVQLIGGLLLLANQYVPLALTILAPVIVNILNFHVTMAPAGLPLALITLALWVIVFFSVREHFARLFDRVARPAI